MRDFDDNIWYHVWFNLVIDGADVISSCCCCCHLIYIYIFIYNEWWFQYGPNWETRRPWGNGGHAYPRLLGDAWDGWDWCPVGIWKTRWSCLVGIDFTMVFFVPQHVCNHMVQDLVNVWKCTVSIGFWDFDRLKSSYPLEIWSPHSWVMWKNPCQDHQALFERHTQKMFFS
jgi:hypothetical protein